MVKRLFFLMTTMLVSLATWAGNLVTVEITFNSETFAEDLEAIEVDETHYLSDGVTTYKAAYVTAGNDGFLTVAESSVDKLKLVVTVPAGQTFDSSAVNVLNRYLSGRWAQYRAVDISSATSLTELPQGAFDGRDVIEEWYFPASITKIGRNALMGCHRARHLQFGTETSTYTNITEIADNGFTSFGDLGNGVSMVFPNVTTIGAEAFYNSGITTFPIPQNNNSLTVIESHCFDNCDKLTSVVIPDGVTTIRNDAFANCDNLETMEIGTAVNSIDVSATLKCPCFTAFTVNASNQSFSAIDGFLLNKDQTEIIRCPQGKTGTEYLTSAFSTVTTIKKNAFHGSSLTKLTFSPNITTLEQFVFTESSIQEVVINDKLTTVEGRAFENAPSIQRFSGTSTTPGCYTTENGILYKLDANGNIATLARVPEGMSQVDLDVARNPWPATLSDLGPSSFRSCKNLTTITLPETITSFGTHTFTGCTGLTTITLPRDLSTFGDAPFQFCSNLETVNLGNNTNFTKEEGIIYEEKNGEKVLYCCPAGLNVERPTIAPNTKVIAAEAFAYTSKIKEIKVPQGVYSIEAGAFHATGAETIVIPHSVTKVGGADVFADVQNLKKLYWLPEKLLTYNYNATENKYTSNLFYQAKLDQISVYVSNEYTSSHEGIYNGAETSLVDLYAAVKGNVGGDKSFGDCKEVAGVYHRALTEDTTDNNLGNTGTNKTNPSYANQTSENDYDFLTLYRDFSAKDGESVEPYYTLVLPVNMSATEVAETFGAGTEIWHFGGRTGKVLNFAKASTIVAGEPCIIRPRIRLKSYMIDLRNSENKTAVAVDDNDHKIGNGKKAVGTIDGSNYDYYFKATYQQGATVPARSYYVTNTVKTDGDNEYGVIKYVTNASTFKKGLRGYIHSDAEDPEVQPAKDMSFDGIVTAIADVPWEEETIEPASFNVYNLNGLLVRSNTNNTKGLPGGVYVVNGKKVIVK